MIINIDHILGGSHEDTSSYSYDHRETDEKIFEVKKKIDSDG